MKTKTPIFGPGRVLMVELKDGSFGYGVLLDPPFASFYDLRTTAPLSDIQTLEKCAILFTIAIDEPKGKRWKVIGTKTLSPAERQPIFQFVQDIGHPERCVIYGSDGSSRVASPQECVGIESAAVWELEHVMDRLLDAHLGRSNKWVETMKVNLPPF